MQINTATRVARLSCPVGPLHRWALVVAVHSFEVRPVLVCILAKVAHAHTVLVQSIKMHTLGGPLIDVGVGWLAVLVWAWVFVDDTNATAWSVCGVPLSLSRFGAGCWRGR